MGKINHNDIAPGGVRLRNLGSHITITLGPGKEYTFIDKSVQGLVLLSKDKNCDVRYHKQGTTWYIKHNYNGDVTMTLLKLK